MTNTMPIYIFVPQNLAIWDGRSAKQLKSVCMVTLGKQITIKGLKKTNKRKKNAWRNIKLLREREEVPNKIFICWKRLQKFIYALYKSLSKNSLKK